MIPVTYRAIFSQDADSGCIGVRFPSFPHIITFGDDWEHALEMASEALNAALETDFDRNQPLPRSTKGKLKKGEKSSLVRIDADIRFAYILRSWREDAELTQKQLAKQLNISYQAYQRMERPGRANLTVNTLDSIAQALGKDLILDLKEAV
jgi:antitoxin HicB